MQILPLQPPVMPSVLMVKSSFSAILCRVKRSFKPYQNEHDSVKKAGGKGKNKCNAGSEKIPMKILFHYQPTFHLILRS